jgi:hypothetical protein
MKLFFLIRLEVIEFEEEYKMEKADGNLLIENVTSVAYAFSYSREFLFTGTCSFYTPRILLIGFYRDNF